MSHADLIARLEALTGPDREVDLEIFARVAQAGEWSDGDISYALGDVEGTTAPPTYTASIDAAVGLVERVLPGSFYHIAKGRLSEQEPLFAAQLLFGADEVLGEGEHRTSPAIALLIATLKALEQQNG